MTPKEILAAEKADPCPFGRVRASNDEIGIVAESLRKNSNFLISDTAARSDPNTSIGGSAMSDLGAILAWAIVRLFEIVGGGK